MRVSSCIRDGGGHCFVNAQNMKNGEAIPLCGTSLQIPAGYCSMSRKNFGLVGGPVWLVSVKVNTPLLNPRAGLARMDQLAYGNPRFVVHRI